MSRKLLCLLAFVASGAFSGCTMCDDSYDYCGPVVGSASFQPGMAYESAYPVGGEVIYEDGAVIEESVPAPMPMPQASRPVRQK